MSNPYKNASDRAFWKKAVSSGFDPRALGGKQPLIRCGDRVASAGSCFASNIVPFIEQAGFEYVRTEDLRRSFGRFAEDNFGYANFSARYGNIYTPRQAVQLVKRALGRFKPVEDRWIIRDDVVVDPFRPGLKYPASSEREFDVLTAGHLAKVLEVFHRANVFVLTLGLTEAWISTIDGAVFPACPGTIAGTFDAHRHAFHNFSVKEVGDDLDEFIGLTRSINPRLRFVLTVSPVPLVATATDAHVLSATIYSKSVLRVAAEEIARRYGDVIYFPSYEIVTGPQAPEDFFETDRRQPSARAIRHVMRAFLSQCETSFQIDTEGSASSQAMAIRTEPESRESLRASAPPEHDGARLSRIIAEAECEEAAAGL